MRVIFLSVLFILPWLQNDDEQLIERLIKTNKVIVLAEVTEVGEAPSFWSGLVLSAQRVKYDVKEVLKGDLAQRRVCVAHFVVHNSRTADKAYPRLAPTIFVKGNRLVLFLDPDPHPGKGYIEKKPPRMPNCGADEPAFLVNNADYGVIPAEEKILKSIRQAISSK